MHNNLAFLACHKPALNAENFQREFICHAQEVKFWKLWHHAGNKMLLIHVPACVRGMKSFHHREDCSLVEEVRVE